MAQAPTKPSPSADLAQQLAASQSSTIYVDVELTDADAAAMLSAEPPLHVERDAVRNLWAVRAATEDEVLAAAAKATAASASSSTPASSSA